MSIKQNPEDFRVEEVLAEAVARGAQDRPGAGRGLALYRLMKQGLATPEAVERVARALRVPVDAVAFGGLKDKHATTIQHITVDFVGLAGSRWARPAGNAKGAPGQGAPGAGPGGRPSGDPAARLTAPKKLGGRNWEIELLGWVAQPLGGGDIAANRFSIVIFDLSMHNCRNMDGAAKMLGTGVEGELAFVNYFGSQRFGTTRHGQGFLAKRLIKGQFEEALKLAIAVPAAQDRPADKAFKHILADHWGDWRAALRKLPNLGNRRAVEVLAGGGDFRAAFAALPYFLQQINVEAYQSYLWNATAGELVTRLCPKERVWDAVDPLRLMRFAAYDALDESLRGLVLPLLSPGTKLQGPWADAAKSVLQQEGIGVEELRIPGMKRPFFGEAPRRLVAVAKGFGMTRPDADLRKKGRFTRRAAFELPRGCYATVLLAAMGQ